MKREHDEIEDAAWTPEAEAEQRLALLEGATAPLEPVDRSLIIAFYAQFIVISVQARSAGEVLEAFRQLRQKTSGVIGNERMSRLFGDEQQLAQLEAPLINGYGEE